MTSVFGPDGRRLKKITSTGTTLYLGADVERAGATWIEYVHSDAKIVGTTSPAAQTIGKDGAAHKNSAFKAHEAKARHKLTFCFSCIKTIKMTLAQTLLC